jgi:frataxin-like iron-binding protein CyaY
LTAILNIKVFHYAEFWISEKAGGGHFEKSRKLCLDMKWREKQVKVTF